jgi:hypothetical protein
VTFKLSSEKFYLGRLFFLTKFYVKGLPGLLAKELCRYARQEITSTTFPLVNPQQMSNVNKTQDLLADVKGKGGVPMKQPTAF